MDSSKGVVPCVPLWERETCASNFSCLLYAKGICFPLTLDPSEEKGENKREVAGKTTAVEVHGKNPTSFNRTVVQPREEKKKNKKPPL